jgi:hypothetical protein
MLSITTVLAIASAVALVGLSFSVSLARIKAGVEVGTSDDVRLLRRIRAQGNFIEYVPMALLLCGLAEYRGAANIWLWLLGALLVLGRVCHAVGMLVGSTPMRAVGMLATYGSLLMGAAALAFA